MVGGIATNKITAIGSGSAEAEAVEAALKPTASKTLIVIQFVCDDDLRFYLQNVVKKLGKQIH